MLNNIKFKSFIHSSSIVKSERPIPDSINPQPAIFNPSRISDTSSHELSYIDILGIARKERESKLQVEKYNPNSKEDENSLEK